MQSAHESNPEMRGECGQSDQVRQLPRVREKKSRTARREAAGSQRQPARQWGNLAATIPGPYIAAEPIDRATRRFRKRDSKARAASRSYPTARERFALQSHVSGARGEGNCSTRSRRPALHREERARGSAGAFRPRKNRRRGGMRVHEGIFTVCGSVMERRELEDCDPYFSFSVYLWH